MNTKKNIHEVRFPNVCMLSSIIYYIVPSTRIIVLAINAVGFLKVIQVPTLQCIMVISKIKYEFFYFFITLDLKMYYFMGEEMKTQT